MSRLGVDVGGTFIDLVLALEDGGLEFEKVLAEPADLVGSITTGIARLLSRARIPGSEVVEVLHATTRGSNVVLERAGPRTALVITRGFRDVLQIQRALRWSMYDVQLEKPQPLVPRSLSFEVSERMLADGSVHTALDEDQLRAVAVRLRDQDVEAIAVAFLHAYANPTHERAAVSILREELPGVIITASSDVSLQAREYERTNTAVVNAYVAKAIAQYMERFVASLKNMEVRAPVWVMQSSGGLAAVEEAVERPVRSLESGPAAGVVGAAAFGRSVGTENVISFDMGGTTAKVAVISGGMPAMTTYFELQRVGSRRGSGLPVDIPALDLVEVGTGGGSIAEVREETLRVGPRSAGADPGPACYGRGGSAPTVTDANLLLGYYDPEVFAGGLVLDVAAAEAAIGRLAASLDVDPLEAAWGIHRVANADMEHAIRLVSINRGFDPREHDLVCTGGAAPAHGPSLARALGCRRAIIPVAASGGSARGLLEAAASSEVIRTSVVQLDREDSAAQCARIIAELRGEAQRSWSAAAGDSIARLTLGMRYLGQGHELPVQIEPGLDDPVVLTERFHQRYESVYGYRDDQPVEVATWQLSLVRPGTQRAAEQSHNGRSTRQASQRRLAYFARLGLIEVDVHDRASLQRGQRLEGPCLITEPTTTTVVGPDDSVEVAGDGTLLVWVGR
jgi:N-methylhydantoinase A